MTIFQKMILVPVLSLLLYGCFITYSYFEHQRSSAQIQELRQDFVPVIELVNDNIYLFEKLQDAFKGAVFEQESRWVNDTIGFRRQINFNLRELNRHPNIVEKTNILNLNNYFNDYYKSAVRLAKSLTAEQPQWSSEDQLVVELEEHQSATTNQLKLMRQAVQMRFEQTLLRTQMRQRELLFWGGGISIASMILLIIITYTVSVTTQEDMLTIVERIKELAQGSTDFSKRIERTNRDELGYLVHWFNKLSDKLEADYLEVKEISITDKLTRLNNRNRTDQFLPTAMEEARKHNTHLVVVLIDIDHFKLVNDTHGHLAGDEVLQQFAQTLKQNAISSDYISRWGGEEFLLVWTNIEPINAAQKANQLRKKIAQLIIEPVGTVTASFGLAVLTDNDNAKSLIARADDNLYQAKERGRNRVIIDQEARLV